MKNTFYKSTIFNDDQIPYFCWDRKLTVKNIHQKLKELTGIKRILFSAWVMREAAFRDVWVFLTPREVWRDFSELKRFPGRKMAFWEYIMGKWHELGKV